MPLSPDLLNEDCSAMTNWADNDYDTGVSEVDPAGQFRFDTNTGATGNAYALRTKDITSPPDTFTFEIKTYFDALGTLADSDYFVLQYGERYLTDSWVLLVMFASDGLYVYKSGGVAGEVGTNIVKCNASAAWQTWRFQVDKSSGWASATVAVYLNDIPQGTVDCDYEPGGAITDGRVTLGVYGITTNDIVAHVEYIKIATGCDALYGSSTGDFFQLL